MCTRRSSEAAPPVAQSSPVQPSPVQSTHHTRHLTYEAGITASDLGFSLAPASPLCTCTFWPQHPQRIYIPSKESVSGALASNFKHDPPERAYRTVFRPPPRPATHPRSQPLTTPTPTRAPTHTHTHTHTQTAAQSPAQYCSAAAAVSSGSIAKIVSKNIYQPSCAFAISSSAHDVSPREGKKTKRRKYRTEF